MNCNAPFRQFWLHYILSIGGALALIFNFYLAFLAIAGD